MRALLFLFAVTFCGNLFAADQPNVIFILCDDLGWGDLGVLSRARVRVQWIADQVASSGEQPFFLYLAYDTPHAALQVPTVPYPVGGGVKGGLQWTGVPGQQQVIFVDGFKGIRVDVKSHDEPFQIYDVAADPAERNDLAGTNAAFDALQAKMHDRVLQIRRPNESAKRPYDNELVPASEKIVTLPGLAWSFYPSEVEYVPCCQSLHRSESGTSDGLTAKPSGSGAIEWSGFAKVEVDGEYTFTLDSAAPALVRIHDATLIDDDFGHTEGQSVTVKIRLAAGLHPIRITTLVTDSKPPKIDLSAEGVTYAASRMP